MSSKKMYGYEVPYESYLTDSFREPEQFGSWSETRFNRVLGTAFRTDNAPDVVLPYRIPKGQSFFVLSAEWNTGDSFGYASCGGFEILLGSRNLGALKEARERILEPVPSHLSTRLRNLVLDGVTHTIYPEWEGYFESLVGLEIHEVTIVRRTNSRAQRG